MSAKLLPVLKQRFFDSNGDPLSGGKLYSYLANSTTPVATYADSDGTVPNTNPVVMDSEGYATVYYLPGIHYKLVLKDADDVTIFEVNDMKEAEPDESAEASAALAEDFAEDALAAKVAAETAASEVEAVIEGATDEAVASAAAALASETAAATSAANAAASELAASASATTAQGFADDAAASADAAALAAEAFPPSVQGSRATPVNVVAGTGIPFSSTAWFSYHFIQGSSGAVDISATPQIQAGQAVGQMLVLLGCSDTNTVKLVNGSGVKLRDGANEQFFFSDSTAQFLWDGIQWTQI